GEQGGTWPAHLSPLRCDGGAAERVVGGGSGEHRDARERDGLIRAGIDGWRRVHRAGDMRAADPAPIRADDGPVDAAAGAGSGRTGTFIETPPPEQAARRRNLPVRAAGALLCRARVVPDA